jgi:hypothetical protein
MHHSVIPWTVAAALAVIACRQAPPHNSQPSEMVVKPVAETLILPSDLQSYQGTNYLLADPWGDKPLKCSGAPEGGLTVLASCAWWGCLAKLQGLSVHNFGPAKSWRWNNHLKHKIIGQWLNLLSLKLTEPTQRLSHCCAIKLCAKMLHSFCAV